MAIHRSKRNEPPDTACWLSENIVEIHQQSLQSLLEKIRKDKNCRYPLVTLQILLQVMCEIQPDSSIPISARRLAKKLDVHYDTVTKCLKYLREIEAMSKEGVEAKTSAYYGKKTYHIHPMIARKAAIKGKVPDYSD